MWFGYEQTQAQCLLFQGFNRYQVVAHPCLLGPWQYKKAEAAAISSLADGIVRATH